MRRSSFLVALALAPVSALASWPAGPWPDCGVDNQEACPGDLAARWYLRSWTANPALLDDPSEVALGSGIAADRAFRTTGGDPSIVLAVLDSGIEWDSWHVRKKVRLHQGELPAPQGEDGLIIDGRYDVDGDGVVTVDDWRWDPRVTAASGQDVADHHLDGSDLIAAFRDGVDDDGNGYVDDIAGWDLHWNDEDPSDDTRFGHGTFEAELSAAEAGDGGEIGVCPDCAFLPVRVGDAFIADPDNIASAILFAVDSGAHVIQAALGALGNSPYLQAAMDYARSRGVVLVMAAGDESAWHPNPPGVNEGAIYVHAVRYNADREDEANTFLNFSNCTNYGPRLDLSVPSTGCASGATGVAAGAAGLILSAGKQAALDPPLDPEEVRQLLLGHVDDIDVSLSRGTGADPDRFPSHPGWEQHFGYGRLNVGRAVEAVVSGRIPPVADLVHPRWFEVLAEDATVSIDARITGRSGVTSWTLGWAPGSDPRDESFLELAAGQGEAMGEIATLDHARRSAAGFDPSGTFDPRDAGEDNPTRATLAHADAITLRLVVVGGDGERAVARKLVFFEEDQREPYPLRFSGSIEASPRIADLDGDGAWELIIATSEGAVHVVDPRTGLPRPGSPVFGPGLAEFDVSVVGNHLSSEGYEAVGSPGSAPIVSTPAVGDLDGDGAEEIVIATIRGEVMVWNADLGPRPGFPVHVDPALSPVETRHRRVERGFLGSPAIADLDGDGTLEIIVGAMDGYIYQWHHDGSVVAGWPVPIVSLGPASNPFNRVVSSVAVGDVDGDGRPDVIAGSNEAASSQYAQLFAIHGDGLDHEGGAYLDGFPTYVFAGYTEILPVVGEGMPTSPALADLDGDGDLEIGANAIADPGVIWDGTGEEWLNLRSSVQAFGPGNNTNESALLQMMNNGAFADLDLDGRPEWLNGAIGLSFGGAFLNDGNRTDFDHLFGAWELGTGAFLPGFPQVVEDLQFFMNPAVADLSGDGWPEVVTTSGGYLVHAWDKDGVEAPGFPRSVRGWAVASPLIEDINEDGFLDLIVATRAGYVFRFETRGPASGVLQWPTFHHDNHGTGSLATPLPGRPPPRRDPPVEQLTSCSCQQGRVGPWPFSALLFFVTFLRSRRCASRS